MSSPSTETLLATHASLLARVRASQRRRESLLTELDYEIGFESIPSPSGSPQDASPETPATPLPPPHVARPDLPPAKQARLARYRNYIPEEETIRNDYGQRYVDSGEWPQNWVMGADPANRFEEYVSIPRHLLPFISNQRHSIFI